MDFNLSEEQEMLRNSAARYLKEKCDFVARDRTLNAGLAMEPVSWQDFADFGWLGISLPESTGGLACSFVEQSVLMEEFGRAMALSPYLSAIVLCGRIIDQASAFGGRDVLLRRICDGSSQLSFAHSESVARYDGTSVSETVAQRVGDGFELRGHKMMCLGAPSAQHFIVSAEVEGETDGGFALFLVDAQVQGLTVDVYALIDGSHAGDLTFDGVHVRLSDMVAPPAIAGRVASDALDRAALATVSEMLGCMEAVTDITAAHIKTRTQFGKPLGAFQVLQHQMAEVFVELQETRSILYSAIASLDAKDAARQASISAAKAYAGSAARFVGQRGIQLHGGIGITEETQVGHYYKRIVCLERLFGDSSFHLERFAKLSQVERAAREQLANEPRTKTPLIAS